MNELNLNEEKGMEIVTTGSMVTDLTESSGAFYSSIVNDGSRASQVRIYNAVNVSDNKLDDHKGEVLEITDVIAHSVNLIDENTGEIKDCTRIVLVAKDGKCYDSISLGVYSSLQKIFAIVGLPHWEEPLKMRATEQKTWFRQTGLIMKIIGDSLFR